MSQSLQREAVTPTADGPWVGTEWIVEAHDCAVDKLRSLSVVSEICDAIIRDLNLNVAAEPLKHPFPEPGGVTMLVLLSESHLACHTYPEYRLATFNLYCCREREAWDWERQLQEKLGAQAVSVRHLPRGTIHLEGTNE